jgi:hypothetical protein
MRIVLVTLLLCLCLSNINPGFAGESKSVVVLLGQSGPDEADWLYGTPSDEFLAETEKACHREVEGNRTALIGALLGVFIDWMFDKAMASVSNRFKRRLAEYSDVYSNQPMFPHDVASRTEKTGKNEIARPLEQCAVFQRFECTDSACKSGELGLTIGFVVQKQATHLRILPYALDLSRPAAKHSGGKYAVAAHLTLLAPQVDANGGAMWSSPEVPLVAHVCAVNKDKTLPQSAGCFKPFVVDADAWKSATILPLPPPTVEAFVVSVAEVGRPPRGLKGLAEFLDTSQGELSDVLSSALKEKLKLTEDE